MTEHLVLPTLLWLWVNREGKVMKKAILLLLLIFGFCKADSEVNKFGVLSEGLSYIHNKDAKIAIKVWLNELASEDYDKELVLDFYDNKEQVLSDFISGELEYLTLNTMHYLENRSKLNPYIRDLYVFLATKDDYISYVLVTKNSNNIKSIKNLKNKTIGKHKSEYMDLLYIDHALLQNRLPTHQKYFSEVKEYDKNSRVLMKLFFNKIDACVIPEYTWDMMTEMNPQISKKLKVLDSSKKIFIPALSLISNKMNDKLYNVHKVNAKKLIKSPKGQQILTLLKSKMYKPVDKAYINPMVDYYKEYLALKKR